MSAFEKIEKALAAVGVAAQEIPCSRPMWLRAPAEGEECRWFGLSARRYRRLAMDGQVNAVRLVKEGESRGITLYRYESVAKLVGGPVRPEPAWPEFLRIPKPGVPCPWFGLTRDVYHRLIQERKIWGRTVRSRGQLKGITLVEFDEMAAFLDDLWQRQRESGS